MTSQAHIRLLLAEDHPVVRRGLRSILTQYQHIEILDEATDGQEALHKARELAPDVVLMDIEMPQLNGLTVTETLAKEAPQIRVLVLSTHSTIHHAMRILKSGARGYVLKQASAEELVKAIETVAAGKTCFSPEVASLALNQLVRKSAGVPDPSQLSEREREILVLIAEGLYNKEIGARLNIGTRTVETHRERIMEKLNIHSAAGLTRFAIATGMVTVPEMQLS
jgi:DNA-binding NarL/FixJ family response regulator